MKNGKEKAKSTETKAVNRKQVDLKNLPNELNKK